MREYNFTDLPIVSWNLHGVFANNFGFRYNKLQSPYFLQSINGAKIFSLLETHHTASEIDQIQLNGYKCFNVCRKKRRTGRNSGGIAVYVHNTVIEGVKRVPSSGSENVLIKLDQNFFGLSRDIVICFSYCVPENSSFQKREQLDVYGDIELKLSSVGQNTDKMLLGDFDARTGVKLDYLQSEDNTDIPVPLDIYEADTVRVSPRLNMDSKTNKYGDNLLSLCKSVPLRICNGRKLGDILGSYTCYTPNGQSCVDYCLVSPSLYDSVRTLSIGDPVLTLSDHCPVRVVLKVQCVSRIFTDNYVFIDKPHKLAWSKDTSYKFENILQSKVFADKFHKFGSENIGFSQKEIDRATIELTDLLVDGVLQADITATPDITRKTEKKAGGRKVLKKRVDHPKWHDISCAEAHRTVVTTAKLLKNDQTNLFLRSKLRKDTKIYNKLVKSKQKQFVENMFTELDTMQNNNPRGYMQLIKSMRDGSFDKSAPDDTAGVSLTQWYTHFSNLLAKNTNTLQKKYFDEYFCKNVDQLISNLDNSFLIEEFQIALKDLKNTKTSSFDKITNGILKVREGLK